MPTMHAEDATITQKCVELYKELSEDCKKEFPDNESLNAHWAHVNKVALDHHNIVAKFGRYPARNKAMGREDTEDEKQWEGNRYG